MTVATPDRWSQLCHRGGLTHEVAAWHEKLIAAWSEPHRHYHNLEHLEDCLLRLDETAHLCADLVSTELALWFHDAVYDPKAPDNEEQSTQLATTFLHVAGAEPQLTRTVESLILATKTHVPGTEPDAPLTLDIDLSILGQPRSRFARYEAGIRHEYAWVSADIFAEKRASILESFLSRPTIYQTPWFQHRLEATARENLTWALQQLRASPITHRGQRDVAP